MSKRLDFYSADDYAREILEAHFSEIPVFGEVAGELEPMRIGALLDESGAPIEVRSAEEMLMAQERALAEKGLYLQVCEPIGGSMEDSRMLETGIAVVIVENPHVNRRPDGIGIPAKVMIRHVIAALIRKPGQQLTTEFHLASGEAFGRLSADAGALAYIVNFEITLLLR